MIGLITGESAVRQMLEAVSESFAKIELKLINHIIDGCAIVSRADMIMPDGREISLADYFEVEDGQFTFIQAYFDPRPMIETWGWAEATSE
jgi:limonene-1,2-epoxide hydrolase